MSKLTMPSNFAAHFVAGTEYETVTKDGMLYLLIPYVPMDAVGSAGTPSKSAAKEEAAPTADGGGKRGRRGAAATTPVVEAPEEKPAGGRRAVRGASAGVDFKAKVLAILTKVDEGDIEEEAGRKEVKALSSDKAIKANLDKVFDEFMSNGDAALEDIAALAADALAGKELTLDAGSAEESGEGEVVELKDLQEGDFISVEFKESDDYEAGWFNGEVTKVAKGRGGKAKVTILFEPAEGQKEGDEMDYDAALMGEIRLISAE